MMDETEPEKPHPVEQKYEVLEKGLKELDLYRPQIFTLLKKYIEEIERFNPAYGLVKVRCPEELIIKHILDSLAPIKIISSLLDEEKDTPANPAPRRIADIGSGAGLPGLPLSICLPDADFTLIERSGRRAGFLQNCIAILGLPNVKLEAIEMERVPAGSFDLAVFRAFRPLEQDILKNLFRLLKPRGLLAAWKGRYENIREEMAAAEKFSPGVSWEIIPVKTPFLGEERHLVLIKSGE